MSAESPVPVLTDGQVTLRALHESDLPYIVEQGSDALTSEWTDVPLPFGLSEARGFLAQADAGWADGSAWTFAVESGGRYCGTVGLTDVRSGRAEITYVAHPEARGEGVIEPALRLLIEWGFAGRGLRTINLARKGRQLGLPQDRLAAGVLDRRDSPRIARDTK